MGKKEKLKKATMVMIICLLCGCGKKSTEVMTTTISVVQETSSLIETTSMKTTTVEITTTEELKLQNVEEKWNEFWSDGEFSYEEVIEILKEAGYHETDSEIGIYENNYGDVEVAGIAWDNILNDAEFIQREDGSYVLFYPNEGVIRSIPDYVENILIEHGYTVEYNNDFVMIYDGLYSIETEEIVNMIMNGEEIPYASNYAIQYELKTNQIIDEHPGESGVLIMSNRTDHNARAYLGDTIYSNNDFKPLIFYKALKGTLVDYNTFGSVTVNWTHYYENGKWNLLYTDGQHYYTNPHFSDYTRISFLDRTDKYNWNGYGFEHLETQIVINPN